MTILNKTIVIFPHDPSISFLSPIIDKIAEIFVNAEIVVPSHDKFDITIDDDHEIVFFFGHGGYSGLSGSINEQGEKAILSVDNASRLFSDTSLILLSCNSVDFMKNVKRNVSLNSFMGFGDMPTDWKHVRALQEIDSEYLIGFNEECLFFYKNAIVKSFLNGLSLLRGAFFSRVLFLGIKQSINQSINNAICCQDWSKDIKLQVIDLLVDFKNEIRYN